MLFILIFLINTIGKIKCDVLTFPEDFLFGVATSAYQIEGGWNASGKGESIWDRFTHIHPEKIKDGSSADIACDSYHKIKEDVTLLKNLNVQFYRFSLSWSRILPNGYANYINPDGIDYYNELLDELVKHDIIPMITLFHWDLPITLQDLGGWTNSLLVDIFTDYANVAFTHFANRVPYWITFNSDCRGYDSVDIPPGINQSGLAEYMCVHVIIKAHAQTYRLYETKFKQHYKGEIGIVPMGIAWYEEKTNSIEDIEATVRAREFSLGYYANPIMGGGNYPELMIDRIAYRSKLEGFSKSRLPEFTSDEKKLINNSYDFLGLNVYTTILVNNIPEAESGNPHYMKDMKAEFSTNPDWPNTSAPWLKVVPDSIRKMLNWYKKKYNNPRMIISENGCADDSEYEDHLRINYYRKYLEQLWLALKKDKVNVVGYAAWSLTDNFEWNDGYTQKFGLYHVNFTHPNRTRKAKLSAHMYKRILTERKLII
ncbi:hypothetical protein FQA39_LY07065 [Lamprigera yunnana]|nr:hypothetical protein FQA39_LY07065 [Lamprigera yunnana]